MIITGDGGCIQLRRRTGETVESVVAPTDINTVLDRFGFAGSGENVITGDRIEVSTNDPRGLVFLPPSFWADNQVHHSAMLYAHVNAMGGIRGFASFTDAINNTRSAAFPVVDFAGAPIPITVDVRDTGHHPLGGIAGYTFNTDRGAVDVTSLGDLFTQQYSAGTISGSGSFDCFFQVQGGLCSVTGGDEMELSMLLPQLLLRADMGGEFDAIFTLATPRPEAPIFYECSGIITRAAVSVVAGQAIELAVDFVTTGEFGLRVGEPSGYILKEDFDRIMREQDIDFLLTEPTD